MYLQNLNNDHCIAYNIKTTSPKNYSVTPNMGIIGCGSQVAVDITFCPSDGNKIETNKFLVQVALTDLKPHEVSPIKLAKLFQGYLL